jgi:protease II
MTLATPGQGPVLELQSHTETVWWPARWTADISRMQTSRAAVRLVVETTLDTRHHGDTVRPGMLLREAARRLAAESSLGTQHHEERE